MDVKPRVAAAGQCNLVLSGGGARGFAHLGVVKALQEKGFSFPGISATSSGAMVGVLLCDGYSTGEIAMIFREALPITRLNLTFRHGLLSIDTLTKILEKHLRHKTFEELPVRFHVALTNLDSGKQVIINSGAIIPAVVASSSIPVLLRPLTINEVPYTDGGISGNLPVESFAGSSLPVVGVHVNPLDKYNEKLSMLRQLERVIHLSIRENVLREMEKTDWIIEPPGLIKYGLFDTDKMDEIIKEGYDFASGLNMPFDNPHAEI